MVHNKGRSRATPNSTKRPTAATVRTDRRRPGSHSHSGRALVVVKDSASSLSRQCSGMPVLASNIGGLPEAKMRIDYLLPVRPIEDYRAQVDDRGLPVPVVPRQDIDPWLAALDRLVTDPVHYNALSEASRTTALGHVSTLTVAPFEKLLERVSADYADTARRGGDLPSDGHRFRPGRLRCNDRLVSRPTGSSREPAQTL